MTEPRLSTVYDYSNLRLHPDGSRVYQNTTNRRPGLAQVTVLDSRAHWIAKDAGGSARVPKLLRSRKKVTEEEEVNAEENIDISRELGGGGEESASDFERQPQAGPSSVRGKKRKATRKTDGRTVKRQKFQTDYEYLSQNATTRSKSVEANTQVNEAGLPAEPSPDLLKCIHRFASEFYSERGQLLNISRQYRQERKLRRVAKAQKLGQGKGKGKVSSSKSTSRSNSDSGDLDKSSGEEEETEAKGAKSSEEGQDDVEMDKDGEADEEREEATEGVKDGETAVEGDAGEGEEDIEAAIAEDGQSKQGDRKKKTKSKPRILPPLVTDMYKVFDGSALLALGMLVQEHVAFLLTPQIPEEWNEDVKKAYTEVIPSPGGAVEGNENEHESPEEDEDEEEDHAEDHIQDGTHEKDELAEDDSADEDDSTDEGEEEDGKDEDIDGQDDDDENEAEVIDIDKDGDSEDDQDRPTNHILLHTNQLAADAMVAETSDNDTSIRASSDEESRSQDTVHSDSDEELI